MARRLLSLILSIGLILGQAPDLTGQETREVVGPCPAHLALLTDNTPHAYERYFEWLKLPGVAEQYANEKLDNTVAVVAVAPVNVDEYKTIFGRGKNTGSTTTAQNQEVEAVHTKLVATYGTDHGARDFNAKEYKRVLQSTAASFVIVIGHNEKGSLRLLDGSSIDLDEIVSSARTNQRVILISCDSANYVKDKRAAGTINRPLTYADAFAVADRITAFVKGAGGVVSLADVQLQLSKDEQIAKTHKIAFFIMKAACFGVSAILVGLIIRQLDPCDNKQTSTCS